MPGSAPPAIVAPVRRNDSLQNDHHLNMRPERARSNDPRLAALRDGWVDGLSGSPPRDAYEAAEKGVQGSYENGRLLAAAAKHAGLEFEFWPADSGLPEWWPEVRALRVGVVPNDRILDVRSAPVEPTAVAD